MQLAITARHGFTSANPFLDLTLVARLEAHFERLGHKRQTSWDGRTVDCIEDWAVLRALGRDNLKVHDEPN